MITFDDGVMTELECDERDAEDVRKVLPTEDELRRVMDEEYGTMDDVPESLD